MMVPLQRRYILFTLLNPIVDFLIEKLAVSDLQHDREVTAEPIALVSIVDSEDECV